MYVVRVEVRSLAQFVVGPLAKTAIARDRTAVLITGVAKDAVRRLTKLVDSRA